MICNFIGMTRDICDSEFRFNLVQWGDPIGLESAAIVVPLGSESPLALQCDHPRWYSSRLDGCMGCRCEAIAAQSLVLVILLRARESTFACTTAGHISYFYFILLLFLSFLTAPMQSPNQLNLELNCLLICSPQPQPHEQILSLIQVTPSLPRSRF